MIISTIMRDPKPGRVAEAVSEGQELAQAARDGGALSAWNEVVGTGPNWGRLFTHFSYENSAHFDIVKAATERSNAFKAGQLSTDPPAIVAGIVRRRVLYNNRPENLDPAIISFKQVAICEVEPTRISEMATKWATLTDWAIENGAIAGRVSRPFSGITRSLLIGEWAYKDGAGEDLMWEKLASDNPEPDFFAPGNMKLVGFFHHTPIRS